jgi:multidrug transporter EmrE-like cation transporter
MATLDITLASLFEIVGDFGFKKFARSGSQKGFLQGSLGYVGVIFYLIQSLKHGNVLYVNGFWDGLSGILESLAAYFILGERLNHPMQYIGLVLITSGLVMLKYFGVTRDF